MNTRIFTIFLLGHGLLIAEDIDTTVAPAPPDQSPAGITQRMTYIPSSLTVEPFAPPPLPVAKQLPSCRIDASVTHRTKSGATLTLQLGEPSTAPDLPKPAPSLPAVAPWISAPDEIALRLHHLRHSFTLGATIYDHRVSVVNWVDPETRLAYEAVCGFDVGLLAGVGGFVHEGEGLSMLLFHSHVETDEVREFQNRSNPNVPEVAEGQILITKGDPANDIGTAPATLLGSVIESEKDRLVVFQAAREAYFQAAAAWAKVHPPNLKNETFIFRPHRGIRYLKKEGDTK